ncbi:MAG TPA: adenylate/guanylate cyclase domain-containing protein [Pseudolabrys sp.]|nr:adenylate/guanylate cyclase domain-containing protein [Pseudolabrys sp.]
MKKLRRIAGKIGLARAVSLVLLAALVVLRIWDPLPLRAVRLRTFDFYQQLAPLQPTIHPVVIADIDEQSLETYGQWPWPRTLLAKLVSKLTNLGAAAIGFDVLFPEPDRMSPAVVARSFSGLDDATRAKLEKLPSNDSVLADAIRHSRVVLGESGHYQALPQSKSPPATAGFALLGPDPSPYLFTFPGLIRDVPVLDQAAAGHGLLNIRSEPDGIVRRVPMVMKADGTIQPAITLEMLRLVTHSGAIRIKTDAAGVQSVAVPGLELPTDRNGQLWIHFGPYDPQRYVSVRDILQDRVPADRINRRLVLIGTSAVGLHDIKATPVDPAMAGVEVHAQVLENVLTNAALSRPNYAIGAELATAVLFCLFVIVLAPILGAGMMLALGTVVAIALAVGSWYFFVERQLLFDATFPLLSSFIVLGTLVFFNYFREQMQRRRIRFAFGQYLAPALVEKLAHSQEELVLGGEEREMTILFSDVRGFTTISETFKHDPHGLTVLMNRFLTPMTNAIIEHNGTIDKYIGDAIMAFWNAPLPDLAQEVDACEAALDMLQRVEALNRQREQEAAVGGHGFVPIHIGIGINTGRCVVGNMGSDLRFNYSVLGDTVNLASRLEGQTKTYGNAIIIGEKTARAVGDKFAVLELDRIRVKGKTEPETIYTVLGRADVAGGKAFERLRRDVGDMLSCYRRRDFAGAAKALSRCRESDRAFGLEGLFAIYAMRIGLFEQAPPPADWDGVFAAETK